MEIRQYLEQIYKQKGKLRYLEFKVKEFKEMAESISGPVYTDMPRSPNRNIEAPFVKYLKFAEEKQEEYQIELRKYLELKIQVNEVIEKLDDPREKMILTLRYIHHKNWTVIGKEMYEDRHTVKKRHDLAIKKIKMPENFIVV